MDSMLDFRTRASGDPFRMFAAGMLFAAAAATILAAIMDWSAFDTVPETLIAGFHALDGAGWAALGFGLAFALGIVVAERRRRDRKFLGRRARGGLKSTLRSMLVIAGAAGLIVGALAVIYASLLAVLPGLVPAPLPLTFQVALPALLISSLAYAAGRFERY